MYLPHAGYVTVRIQSGQYGATWWEAAAPADRSTVLQRHCPLAGLACGTWRGQLDLS